MSNPFAEKIISRYRKKGLLRHMLHSNRLQRNCLRSLVRAITQESLDDFAGRPIRMEYDTFDWDIRTCHKIDIGGWPADIPFQNPGTLPPDELDRLLAGWRSGEIYFFHVPSEDFTPGKKKGQKTRSDAGEQRVALTPKFVPEAWTAGEDVDEIAEFETEKATEIDEIEQFSD
ncbi:hypothetical protein EIP91_001383 [Steccherinum ochraceum]|uniref:Uncharacterized protein n=1 Tax=Steccherinum ochraceum TaxID=92696 RepID=A0A4R0RGL7_9APHY|nr:hypothetical protein EIP91_001383 [Steccherinum ochraceum]